MRKKKFYFFIGTTAELIKLAPVIKELKQKQIPFKIIASGQGKLLFGELSKYLGNLKADIVFAGKTKRSSVLNFIFWAIKTFFNSLFVFRKEFKGLGKKNLHFIVHGDTISSLVGALATKISKFGAKVKLVHIESGLRSFNFFEPFPEEITRYVISKVSDVHFCPNEWALKNLKNAKGIKINTHQNTLIESYFFYKEMKKKVVSNKISQKYFVLIIHRQEHVIFNKEKTINLIKFILENKPVGMKCILIAHHPTWNVINRLNIINKDVIMLNRLAYIEFMSLLENSEFVLTDGGSNQEELFYMGKPTLVLRSHTERIEGLGKNILLYQDDLGKVLYFFKNYKNFKLRPIRSVYHPSRIIVDNLLSSES
jgi:UDP-N-acetylglucosamine 2-epimerase (non-hydrolysing)